MNDNSTLDFDAQDRNVNNDNYTDSLKWSHDSDDDCQERHDSERQKTTRCVMSSGQSCTASTDNSVKEKENPTVTDSKVPQKGARVASKLFDDDQEQEATIIGCAGRATGRNKF